jgi:hypothetical protein
MSQVGGGTGGGIVYGCGIEVELVDSLVATVESSFNVAEYNELLIPVGSGETTVAVEDNLGVDIEVCG